MKPLAPYHLDWGLRVEQNVDGADVALRGSKMECGRARRVQLLAEKGLSRLLVQARQEGPHRREIASGNGIGELDL